MRRRQTSACKCVRRISISSKAENESDLFGIYPFAEPQVGGSSSHILEHDDRSAERKKKLKAGKNLSWKVAQKKRRLKFKLWQKIDSVMKKIR